METINNCTAKKTIGKSHKMNNVRPSIRFSAVSERFRADSHLSHAVIRMETLPLLCLVIQSTVEVQITSLSPSVQNW